MWKTLVKLSTIAIVLLMVISMVFGQEPITPPQEPKTPPSFYYPRGVSVDESGNVYVLDYATDTVPFSFEPTGIAKRRVHKFDAQGRWLNTWNIQGPQKLGFLALGAVDMQRGQVSFPLDITTSGGYIYLVDAERVVVEKYDSNGKKQDLTFGEQVLRYPTSIAVDSSQSIYVTDGAQVKVFDNSGKSLRTYKSDRNLDTLMGVAVSQEGLFVTGDQQVFLLTDEDTVRLSFEAANSMAGDIAVGDDTLFVCDVVNSMVQKFTKEGKFLIKWGSRGAEEGKFDLPMGIAVDNKRGYVYVADIRNHRVQKFNIDGQFLDVLP